MAWAMSFSELLLLIVFVSHVGSGQKVVEEEGYTVRTVMNGHKVNIIPHTVFPLHGSSQLLLLDTANSAFFTLSLPLSLSQESVIKRLNGNRAGYSDGELNQAKFKNPQSFAVDQKGNIYVADRLNRVIRKITKSGVTTIATGFTLIKENEPAKNTTFSQDFEVAFVPQICALLVTDHSNWLIHQIDLKPQDCVTDSHSHSLFELVLTWVLGLLLSCLIGFALGFVIRPYITKRHTETVQPPYQGLDGTCLPQFQALDALPNKYGETSSEALLRYQKRSCELKKLETSFADPLADLLSLDASTVDCGSTCKVLEPEDEVQGGRGDILCDSGKRINAMIQANIMDFTEASNGTAPVTGPLSVNLGLVKRK